MTRRLVNKYHVACALVLSIGLISWAVAVAGENARWAAIKGAMTRTAAITPSFDPAQPGALDEFAPNPNLQSVHFDFDKAAIRANDAMIVDRNARWLQANPPYHIVVEGYADERGTKEYNMALAKRRAMAVRDQLIARGVEPASITIVSYGEARPECYAKMRNESCWSKNRRADLLVRRVPVQTP